jgi:hypothetical protein
MEISGSMVALAGGGWEKARSRAAELFLRTKRSSFVIIN